MSFFRSFRSPKANGGGSKDSESPMNNNTNEKQGIGITNVDTDEIDDEIVQPPVVGSVGGTTTSSSSQTTSAPMDKLTVITNDLSPLAVVGASSSPQGGFVTPVSVTGTGSSTAAGYDTGASGGSKMLVEDEPEEDPERAQLENVVRQRDMAISALEKARLEKEQQLQQLDKELENERLQQMKEILIHKIDIERIKRQTMNAEERLKSLEQDMSDKVAIHEYANLIKGVAPKAGIDSQYVMKLQSQLQKAVKKMEATTIQMKELEDTSEDVLSTLNNEIAVLVEERCKTELELRKQMDVLQVQKNDMQIEYEDRINENLKTLQALKAKATKQTTIEELEYELEETENKLNELHRIQQKQQKTIEQLNKSLSAQENGI